MMDLYAWTNNSTQAICQWRQDSIHLTIQDMGIIYQLEEQVKNLGDSKSEETDSVKVETTYTQLKI